MSSLMIEQQVVQHFTHIHPLTKVDEYGEFTCGGCKTYGFGKTYRCATCDYNLHDHCATCPSTLNISYMHPDNELQLVFNGPEGTCNICHGLVEGFYYRCETCGFNVHPLCALQPQHVRYVPHPAHLLELSQCGTSSTCMVCRDAILSWRYKCRPCGFEVHVECVNSSKPAAMDIKKKSSESQLDLHTSDQYLQPYNDECGHTNKGHGQVSGPSKRKKVFRFFKDLTVDIVCTIIAEMGAEFSL